MEEESINNKLEDAFKKVDKLESVFKNTSIHGLLVIVGQLLHDSIDYSNLFQQINSYEQFKNLHITARTSTLEDDLQNADDEEKDDFYNQMILRRRQIETTQMINIKQIERMQATAKLALEFAVKKAETKAELLQCAKYIEFEIDDKDWANEVRKKV